LPKARNEAKAQNDWYMKTIAPYTGELGKVTSSAADIGRTRMGLKYQAPTFVKPNYKWTPPK